MDKGTRLAKQLPVVTLHVLLILSCIAMLFPFVWMLSTSLKSVHETLIFPPVWIPDPLQWNNYLLAVTTFNFGRFWFNSMFVTVITILGQLALCSMAAYAFARLKFPGRNVLFLFYISTLMIPQEVKIVPMFIMMKWLGWLDSYEALIVPSLFNPFGIFLLRQFFTTLPVSLEEAALIDGAGRVRIFFSIVLPLSKPALGALSILTAIASWNSFLWPLIVTFSESMRTIPVGLALFVGEHTTAYHHQMAAASLSTIPIIIFFIIMQKHFVKGIVLSGIKG